MNTILDAFARMSTGAVLRLDGAGESVAVRRGARLGDLLVRSSARLVGPAPDPLEFVEVGLALSCVALNTLVTYVGWRLCVRGLDRDSSRHGPAHGD